MRLLAPCIVLLAAAGTASASPRACTFLYVMSYDNDLDTCTEPILDALAAGVVNDRVGVAVLSDRPGDGGLRHITLTNTGGKEEPQTSDDITDPQALRAFLEWAVRELPAERYAVVFLDHGGRLDEMCADQFAGVETKGMRWMSARRTGDVLREWKAGLKGGTVELLFLQQCGRGSLENLYNFRGVAEHVLASETIVGACNTYYTQVVKAVAGKPETRGDAIARLIMEHDQDYMTYCLVDGRAIEQLPQKLNLLVDALEGAPVSRPAKLRDCFRVHGEHNYDALTWIERATAEVGPVPRSAIDGFREWLERDLVKHVQRRGSRADPQWCGLSVFVPDRAAGFSEYAEQPLYVASRWDEFVGRVIEGGAR